MKKLFLSATLAAMLASCTSDFLKDEGSSKPINPEGPISFVMSSQNMTRATSLQATGLYSFGVFAYKSTEPTYNMMENYLVGYMDKSNKQGYYMTEANQTTLGDIPGAANGSSMWAYEKMGNTEYDYTGAEGYYTKTDLRYMSNVDKQYLRYWDKSADYTMFYAYTPYQNAAFTGLAAVSYDNSTKTMTIPGGAIHDGYNNPTDNEFMFASAKVEKANYGQDVPLKFKHLVAKCNIKFWEDIDGYSVRILNLSNDFGGVYAVPAKKSTTDQYSLGSYYKTSGASIVFDAAGNGTVSQTNAVAHDMTQTTEALQFAAPEANAIGTTNATASASPTTYYAIPKDATTGGFTFHVSYELTSTTGERITVNNATVWVPDTKCNWEANKHYTYVFKITKNTNGTTDNPGTINPLDPEVSGEAALLPIIFDNCTIEDWDLVDGGEHNIADANTKYYSISLDKGSVVKSTSSQDITATLLERGTAVSSAAGTWSLKKPGATTTTTDGVTAATDPKTATVTVGADWAVGEYTLIFTPDASMSAPNATYETKFYVIDQYKVTLNANEVGTRGTDKSELTITTDAYAYKAGYLSIEYPSTVTSGDDKNKVRIEGNKVVVMKEAVAGDYKIVYTVGTDVKSSYSFKVVDYALNTGITGNSVGLSQTTQEFNVTSTASSVATKVYTITAPTSAAAGQVTFDEGENKIKVTKDATVGQYKLTLVVTNNGTKTTYERTFEVKNVYSLKIYEHGTTTDCTLVDNDTPTDGNPLVLDVVATKNGATDASANITVSVMTGVSYDTTNKTITIERNATPSNYIVTWKEGGDIVASAQLVVTD